MFSSFAYYLACCSRSCGIFSGSGFLFKDSERTINCYVFIFKIPLSHQNHGYMLYASVVGVIVCSSFVFVFLFPIFARWQSKYLVAITEENHMRQSLTYCFFFSETYTQKLLSFYLRKHVVSIEINSQNNQSTCTYSKIQTPKWSYKWQIRRFTSGMYLKRFSPVLLHRTVTYAPPAPANTGVRTHLSVITDRFR